MSNKTLAIIIGSLLGSAVLITVLVIGIKSYTQKTPEPQQVVAISQDPQSKPVEDSESEKKSTAFWANVAEEEAAKVKAEAKAKAKAKYKARAKAEKERKWAIFWVSLVASFATFVAIMTVVYYILAFLIPIFVFLIWLNVRRIRELKERSP